jgi:four helix bundle protein
MAFQVEELSLELIGALAPLMPRIKQRDKALEDQLRRAASSIGLNCAEAAFSDPGNRRARLFTAAGSAGETRHALRQAVAWRLVTAGEAEPALKLVERIVAILWRMTRGWDPRVSTERAKMAAKTKLVMGDRVRDRCYKCEGISRMISRGQSRGGAQWHP